MDESSSSAVRKRLLDTKQMAKYGVDRTEPMAPNQHLAMSGRQEQRWRRVGHGALCVTTLGLSLLLFHWRPAWGLRLRSRACSLAQATHVLIKDAMGQEFVATVEGAAVAEQSLKELHLLQAAEVQRSDDEWGDTVQLHADYEERPNFRFFVFQHSRYTWNPTDNTFTRLGGLSELMACNELHGMSTGLSREQQIERRKVFGPNIIDVPLKSYPRLLMEEILNPFYIFQILSVLLWMLERYYYYAVCIVIISAISIGFSLYETRKQSVTLRDMVRATVGVNVRRADGAVERIDSSDLVPGDCLLIPAGDGGGGGGDGDGHLLLPFDAALVRGSSCIVNESMLTGESVPVTKTAVGPREAARYSAEEHKRHTLFCGTSVIQVKPGAPHTGGAGSGGGGDGDGFACAVVTRTGFYTAKGELVRAILYPRPVRFRFYRDAVRFVLFLAVLAAIGDIYSIVILVKNKISLWSVVLSVLDLVTIVVPPALPAAVTVGQAYAQGRLRRVHGVFCVSPPSISVAGKVKVVCLDKTGTLTEDNLELLGVVPVTPSPPSAVGGAGSGAGSGAPAVFSPLLAEPRRLPRGHRLSWALASCHSLARLRGGRLVGDPIDINMVEGVAWTLQEVNPFGPHPPYTVGVMKPTDIHTEEEIVILNQFQFSSTLQRMSVVVSVETPRGHGGAGRRGEGDAGSGRCG